MCCIVDKIPENTDFRRLSLAGIWRVLQRFFLYLWMYFSQIWTWCRIHNSTQSV